MAVVSCLVMGHDTRIEEEGVGSPFAQVRVCLDGKAIDGMPFLKVISALVIRIVCVFHCFSLAISLEGHKVSLFPQASHISLAVLGV